MNVKGKMASVFRPREPNEIENERRCSRSASLEADGAGALEGVTSVAAAGQVPLCALDDVHLVGRVEAEEEREAADDDVERRGRADPSVVKGVDDVERRVAACGRGDDGFEAAVGGGSWREKAEVRRSARCSLFADLR